MTGDEDQPVHTPPIEEPEIVRLLVGIVVSIAEERGVPGRTGGILDRTHELREERIGDVGDDTGEDVRACGLQAARYAVRLEAELGHRLPNTLGDLSPHCLLYTSPSPRD